MNQIPNIEETHNTIEIEEKLETYFPADLRMRAYYYGFKPTRVRDIDKVLSAVAIAGKAFHSTDQWVDEMYEEGVTAEKLIQYAADAAAINIHHQLQKARQDGYNAGLADGTDKPLLAIEQMLQKAREEERERIEKDLDRRLEIQKKVSHSEYEGGYTHALQDVKEAIHSELDQDTPKE